MYNLLMFRLDALVVLRAKKTIQYSWLPGIFPLILHAIRLPQIPMQHMEDTFALQQSGSEVPAC